MERGHQQASWPRGVVGQSWMGGGGSEIRPAPIGAARTQTPWRMGTRQGNGGRKRRRGHRGSSHEVALERTPTKDPHQSLPLLVRTHLDGVGRLHVQRNGLASEGLDEDLHTSGAQAAAAGGGQQQARVSNWRFLLRTRGEGQGERRSCAPPQRAQPAPATKQSAQRTWCSYEARRQCAGGDTRAGPACIGGWWLPGVGLWSSAATTSAAPDKGVGDIVVSWSWPPH